MLERTVDDGDIVVPPDQYFAMGRQPATLRSIRATEGFVPRANIIGKPLLVYWSYDAPTDRLASAGISFEHVVDLARNFFVKTRWKRTFIARAGL